jgi:hypothetical protein
VGREIVVVRRTGVPFAVSGEIELTAPLAKAEHRVTPHGRPTFDYRYVLDRKHRRQPEFGTVRNGTEYARFSRVGFWGEPASYEILGTSPHIVYGAGLQAPLAQFDGWLWCRSRSPLRRLRFRLLFLYVVPRFLIWLRL